MKKLNALLQVITVLEIVFFPFHVDAKADYSLLIGEWSEPGACNQMRYVYTADRRYMWMEKKKGSWTTNFEGIYVPLNNTNLETPGAVIISERANQGGNYVEIHKLNQTTYSGMWNTKLSEGLSFDNPDDAFFAYVRCPSR